MGQLLSPDYGSPLLKAIFVFHRDFFCSLTNIIANSLQVNIYDDSVVYSGNKLLEWCGINQAKSSNVRTLGIL